jgi:glycosyltransferase involved in cell wall biosynthesis
MPTAILKPAHAGVPSTALLRASKVPPLDVVIVDEELPYPPTSGKRLRTLNLTLRLARRHRITFLCHRNRDRAEALRARAFFLEHGIRTVVADRAVPRKSGPFFPARLAANLLSDLPYSVTSHNSRSIRRAIRHHAAIHPVDLWHCEWTPYAAAVRDVPGARWLVTAHNIESQLWQRYHEHETNTFKRWYIAKQLKKFLRFERQAFAEALTTITVSPEDAALAAFAFGAANVDVVDNGVDTAFFQPPLAPRCPGRVLFLASLDWRPNLDAAVLMLDRIWPEVLARQPTARLQIVGRQAPAWLKRRAAASPNVELHVSVPDVRPFLISCSVLAVPLRIASGSRLKILEALASETPVVATRVGAEGLQLNAGEHLTVVDSCEQMAGGLLDCLGDPETAQARAQRGRQEVLLRYDWDVLADKLEQVWLRCVPTLGQ